VTIFDYQVTIDLTGNALGNGKLYHVLIPSGAFTSYASQSYAGISTSTWRFKYPAFALARCGCRGVGDASLVFQLRAHGSLSRLTRRYRSNTFN
jgi:hypothetical protein